MSNEGRTLEELNGEHWGAPETAPTPMVERCLRLRQMKLEELCDGDVRLLVSQKIGVRHVIPKAFKLLAADAVLETDYFPGDLLCALMKTDRACWFQF